jgi:hypothetical protein
VRYEVTLGPEVDPRACFYDLRGCFYDLRGGAPLHHAPLVIFSARESRHAAGAQIGVVCICLFLHTSGYEAHFRPRLCPDAMRWPSKCLLNGSLVLCNMSTPYAQQYRGMRSAFAVSCMRG